MSKQPRNPRRARKVFLKRNGPGPWPCFVETCDKLVTRLGQKTWDGNIHHLDGMALNDVPENLVVGHTICHLGFHPHTDDQRQKISDALKGRPSPTKGMQFSPEVNAKKARWGQANGYYGKHHTEEIRAKMRKPRRRLVCEACGREFALNWINRHREEGRCVLSPVSRSLAD